MQTLWEERVLNESLNAGLQTATKNGSHLRPKILICKWSFCWGRHWRLYIFTCYDHKDLHVRTFSWLFCDHIFCFVHVLNLKLKDDTHQVSKQSSSLPHSSADAPQSAKHSSVVQRERRSKWWRRCKCRKDVVYFYAQLEQTSTG